MLSRIIRVSLITVLLMTYFSTQSLAEVEWSRQKTLPTKNTPIDMAMSSDGKFTFVLTDAGKVLIYSAQGTLEDTIPVGNEIKGINLSPKGDTLFLLDSKTNAVQVLSIDFVQQINYAGSPFKGKEDASVIIAIFSDFQ